jgi:hypothetical protein
MFAIIEKRYDEIVLKLNTRQMSSVKIEALMKSFIDTFHYADMTADMAFLSSEVFGLRRASLPKFSNSTIKRDHNPTDRLRDAHYTYRNNVTGTPCLGLPVA